MEKTMFDKIIYSPDFQLDGSYFVEASAGTGKTYNIQNIYARLIMEKGLKVSGILVVTYTDAATKELRDRLHMILQNIQGRFSVPQKDCPGRDESEIQARNKQADDLIRCAKNPELARMNVELALLEFDQNAISTIHGFCQRILTRYAFDAGVNFVQDIENNKEAELNSLAEDWWRKPHKDAPDGIKFSTLATYVRKLSGKNDYVVKNEDPRSPEGYLLERAQEIVKKYEEKRGDSSSVTYDDLLHFVRNALKKENPGSQALIAKLRKEFQAALIDEFQDTDPVQYEIFERIFLNGNQNPLFFVGDPKQAIYAFRGGDIFTYLKAKSIPGLRSASLNVNHRSAQRIMDAVNGMFIDSGKHTFEHECIDYPYPGSVVEQEPKIKGPALDKPFEIIQFVSLGKKGPGFAKDMPKILEWMTAKIIQLLNEKDGNGNNIFSPGDIAILTNSNDRNRKIHQILMNAHIPSVVRKSGNVFSSPVAKELWLFLLTVSKPEKKTMQCAISTVFCGWFPPPSIPNAADTEIFAEQMRYFNALNQEWRSHGLAAMLASLENNGYRKRIAVRPDGVRQLADISQIWELSFAAIKQIGSSPEKLVAWLAERINGAADVESENEEYYQELETDEDAVKIMTVHIAKGLQFPIVFLPDCWKLTGSRGNETSMPVYHENDGEGTLTVSLSDKAKKKEKQEQYQEKIRLLYVAMTRAVQRMILFTPDPDKIQKEPLSKLLTNLKSRSGENPPYQILDAAGITAAGEYIFPAPDISKKAEPLPVIKNLPCKGSFSSLFYKQEKEDDDDRDIDSMAEKFRRASDSTDGKEHPVFQLPNGAVIGTCWHNILEKISFDAKDAGIRKTANEELTDSGLIQKEGILDVTAEMIRKTLHYAIHSPSGESFSLRDVPRANRLSEQGFDFSASDSQMTDSLITVLQKYWDGDSSKEEFLKSLSPMKGRAIPKGFMTGFVDLIFQHGDYFYIIDWKSNSIGGKRENFTETGVRHEMAQHLYFFQYLLYAVVLHFYLKQTLGSRYSWNKNFGGIRYFFLRGIAADGEAPVFEDRPSAELLDALGHAFGLTEKE